MLKTCALDHAQLTVESASRTRGIFTMITAADLMTEVAASMHGQYSMFRSIIMIGIGSKHHRRIPFVVKFYFHGSLLAIGHVYQ